MTKYSVCQLFGLAYLEKSIKKLEFIVEFECMIMLRIIHSDGRQLAALLWR